MTAATTYSSLVTDVLTYAERSDEPFIDQVPRFIALAENRLASETKLLGNLNVVSGTLNGATLEKPIRWRKTKSLAVRNGTAWTYLILRGYEYCRMYSADTPTPKIPEMYADYDYEHLFLSPEPDQNYEFELQYYDRPQPLSDVNQTNWFTQYAPQALLYATMMEAMPFLKTPERIAEFQTLYDRAIGSIQKEDAERIVDASADRR